MADPTLTRRVSECGREFAGAAAPAFTTPAGVHVPTLIAACARMAGSYLLRSFGLPLEAVAPGEAVLSAPAGEHVPGLLRTCAVTLKGLGTPVADAPGGPLIEAANRPLQGFLETQRALDPVFAPIRAKHALDDRHAAIAAAIATAILIHHLARFLEPTAGFGIAAYGFAEGARTKPVGAG